jgi:hypothetical protein
MPAWIPRTAYVLVFVTTVAVLIAHTLKVDAVQVDTTTLGLLALLLLVPLAPYIKRLSAGGVEAEIGEREAQQLQAAAADLPPQPEPQAEVSMEAPTVQELINRDPPLGLAKLRIDLERELRALYLRHVGDGRRRVGLSLGLMTRELVDRRVVPLEIANPLNEVTQLANRAVHGEYVPRDVAEEIADVGLRVLNALRLMNEESKREP